jgi:hypothetical protein
MDASINLLAGWAGFLGGAVTGALLGLKFHHDDWLGGYASFARRMLRLGHIACFGLGLINILFALTAASLASSTALTFSSRLLVLALITMPLTCFLSAWRKTFRHGFVIPAGATLVGLVGLLIALA